MRFLISAIIALCAFSAQAKETIEMVWGFNIGSNQANTMRVMIEELNKTQDRYTFVLVSRPGAGGTIAANYVNDNPNTAIVSMSSSFIIRPYYEKNDPTHNLDNFTPLLVQGSGSPLVIVSSKYTKLDDVLASRDVSAAVSGAGSIGHFAANLLASNSRKVTPIHFKNNIEGAAAAAGHHVDVATGFWADVQPLVDAGKVRVIGYTGTADIPGHAGLQLNRHGIKDATLLTANFAFFASRSMDQRRASELIAMLAKVNTHPLVQESLARDLLVSTPYKTSQLPIWYSNERSYWQQQIIKANN